MQENEVITANSVPTLGSAHEGDELTALTNLPGIYKITNTQTLDFYIGSAGDMSARWRRHRWDLRGDHHPNRYLQRSYNKYGHEFFIYEVIETCAEDQLLIREQHYLDTLKPPFNIAEDAKSPMKGRKHTEEAKAKISEGCKGITHIVTPEALARLRETRATSGRLKPVVAKDPVTGEIRHRFGAACDVETMGWKKSAVLRCVAGKMASYQGFVWECENPDDATKIYQVTSDETRKKLSDGRKGKTHTPEMKAAMRAMKKCKVIESYDLKTGQTIKVYPSTRAVIPDGFSQARVGLCANGKGNEHKGLGWRFVETTT
jgi:group I intron endonuclease